jgi:ribosome silencing factor RsfS/YbeB/iojap
LSKTQSALALAKWISQILDRKGAHDIVVLDLRKLSSVTDFLVIGTGTSSRHLKTLIEAPCVELKKVDHPPLSIEGENTGWVLADLGDVVLHVFDQETREYYDLEGLWKEAPQVEIAEKKNPLEVLSL